MPGRPPPARGALAALASNFALGQGIWTPWQMLAWGACGAAGALVAMTWVIHPFIGTPYTIRSFMIVVVAGVGNVAGVILAALGLGALEQFAGFLLGVEFQLGFVFALLLAILLWRNWRLRRERRVLR